MTEPRSIGTHALLADLPTTVASGVVIWPDRDEVVRAGELYYMAPGHTMAVEAGTVLVEFSPREQFEQLTEIAEKNFARLGKGGDEPASSPSDR